MSVLEKVKFKEDITQRSPVTKLRNGKLASSQKPASRKDKFKKKHLQFTKGVNKTVIRKHLPTSSQTYARRASRRAGSETEKNCLPKFRHKKHRDKDSLQADTVNHFSKKLLTQKGEEFVQSRGKTNDHSSNEDDDPYPGDAPVSKVKLNKHSRGAEENLYHTVSNIKLRTEIKQREKNFEYANQLAARAELLLPEESGFLEPDEGEHTSEISQVQIKNAVDITSATKHFDLSLQFGPYAISYLRNGRKLLIGGRKGHVAAFDWITKNLTCEINVMESVFDISWLHNETMFAVAQKDWTYIYDNSGVEIHCIKKMNNVLKMEFLPYHFLLASSNEYGRLNWLDVSMGKMVKQTKTHLGRLDVMCQNPSNAVLCCGHSRGTVTMWTPNVEQPVVKMLCQTQPIRACAIDQSGNYLATSAVDSSLKIWDLRTYNCLHSYRLGVGASNLAFSQRGLLAVSLGNTVEVYQDIYKKTVDRPYLRHNLKQGISSLEFCPYEDVLGVGYETGICSMLVPGAGEPNFDAFESNPFQTKTQRQESEVKALLEKIQPELITMDPFELGEVDRQTIQEKFHEKTRFMFEKPPKVDVRPRKNAKSVNQHRLKQRLQLEARKKHASTTRKAFKGLAEKETPRQPAQKPGVLDRFKRKA